MRRTTSRSIHRLTFNSNDSWLSEIVDLTTLKLFGLRLRGLQSRCGKNSHRSASPYKSYSASARSSRFRLCCKDFAKIFIISNRFTKSKAAHIHRFARFIPLLGVFGWPLDMTFETRAILQVDYHWGMFSHPRFTYYGQTDTQPPLPQVTYL